jgi:hypothetical protein
VPSLTDGAREVCHLLDGRTDAAENRQERLAGGGAPAALDVGVAQLDPMGRGEGVELPSYLCHVIGLSMTTR